MTEWRDANNGMKGIEHVLISRKEKKGGREG
jgi:hypothetical protein